MEAYAFSTNDLGKMALWTGHHLADYLEVKVIGVTEGGERIQIEYQGWFRITHRPWVHYSTLFHIAGILPKEKQLNLPPVGGHP